MKKVTALLLAVVLVLGLMTGALAADGTLSGKTVILHTNDVHGEISLYAKVAALKKDYQAQGADVILADAGDYIQGTPYVSDSKGASAVDLMNAAGYDIATFGNHEFDYGFDNLVKLMGDAKFKVIGNICYNGKPTFNDTTIITTSSGLKVGFLGLTTPETSTKAHPAKIQGVTFMAKDELYKFASDEAALLRKDGADVVIALTHLGVDPESEPNRSADVYANSKGIDFIIDGHSHTVMTKGENNEPIQSTGTKLENVGVIIIDNATKKIEKNELLKLADYKTEDETVKAAADAVIKDVDTRLGKVFAKTEVDLDGSRDPGVRTKETNLGDLITDGILWYATKDGKLDVPADHVVALTNGGGIRASIKAGDISMKDINTVLPFGNTVAVIYISGASLLEALEASTYSLPTSIGGFPQVSGIRYTVVTGAKYDANKETYPGSTYYGPKSIQRVTIDSINGKAFNPSETYAVVTNDFTAAGGDTYYTFKTSPKIVDTGVPMDEAVVEYIKTKLGGVVGKNYASAQNRITMKSYTDVKSAAWYAEPVEFVTAKGLMNGSGAKFNPTGSMDRAMLVTVLYRLAGSPEVEGKVSEKFKDCKDGAYYEKAVLWAAANGIVAGYSDGTFKPSNPVNRQELAKILYGYDLFAKRVGQDFPVELTYADLDSIPGWALEAVTYCTAAGYLQGSNGAFHPKDKANRAQGAKVLMEMAS